MMKSSLFFIAKLKNKTLTIAEISNLVIQFYRVLSKFHSSFQSVEIGTSKNKVIITVKDDSAVELLAESILNKNKTQIKRITKKDNIDINFSWEKDISFALTSRGIDNDEFLSLFFGFSNNKFTDSQITSIVAANECFNTGKNIFHFLNAVVDVFDVNYTTLKLTDDKYVDLSSNYKLPLGLITYLSNDCEVFIPNDLNGVEYEYLEEGKYLSIVLEEEFIEDDMELYREKLLGVMDEIKRKFPEYAK